MFEKFKKHMIFKTFIITATALFVSFFAIFLMYSTIIYNTFEQHATDKSLYMSKQIDSKLIRIKNTACNFLHTKVTSELFEKYDSSFLNTVFETKSISNYFDGIFAVSRDTCYYSDSLYLYVFSDYITELSNQDFILQEENAWRLHTIDDGTSFITFSQQVYDESNNPKGVLVFCVLTTNPTFLINHYPSTFIDNTKIKLSFDGQNCVTINSAEPDYNFSFADTSKSHSSLSYTLTSGAHLKILTSSNYVKTKLFTLVLILSVTYIVFMCLFYVILYIYIKHAEKQLDSLYVKMVNFNTNP